MAFHLEIRNRSRKVHCELKTQSEDKPDMIEADTTYLWQMPSCIDAKVLCASVPASSTNNIHADMGISLPVSAFLFPNIPRFVSLV